MREIFKTTFKLGLVDKILNGVQPYWFNYCLIIQGACQILFGGFCPYMGNKQVFWSKFVLNLFFALFGPFQVRFGPIALFNAKTHDQPLWVKFYWGQIDGLSLIKGGGHPIALADNIDQTVFDSFPYLEGCCIIS